MNARGRCNLELLVGVENICGERRFDAGHHYSGPSERSLCFSRVREKRLGRQLAPFVAASERFSLPHLQIGIAYQLLAVASSTNPIIQEF